MSPASPAKAPRSGGLPWRDRLFHWPLFAALAVATFLRSANLSPTFLYGDDAEYAIVARYLSREWDYLAYPAIEGSGAAPFVSQPPLILYFMAASMNLFGPTDLAAVVPSVLFGIATVAVVYAIGYQVSGRMTATLAAVLLAVAPMHVSMSRKAFLDAGLTFFMSVTILFALLWSRSGRLRHAVLAGAAAGATCLSKLPGVLVVGALLPFFALELVAGIGDWARGRKDGSRRAARVAGHGLAAGGVIAGSGVLYLLLLEHLGALTDLWYKLVWQLGRVAPGLAKADEITAVEKPRWYYFTDPQHSIAGEMGFAFAALALAGAVWVAFEIARRPGKNRHLVLLLLWPAVILGFFTASARKEWFYALPAIPALCVLAAFVPGRVGAWLSPMARETKLKPRRRAATAALAATLLFSAVPAAGTAQESVERFALSDKIYGYGVKEAALEVHKRDPGAAQIGSLLGRFTVHFYNEQPTYHWYVDHTKIENGIREGEVRYLILDNYLGLAHEDAFFRHLVNEYDGKVVGEWKRDWGRVQLVEFEPG